MKKLLLVFCALLVLLAGCKKHDVTPADSEDRVPIMTDADFSTETPAETTAEAEQEPAEEIPVGYPAEATLLGISLEGMTREEAILALQEAVSGYTLTVTVGDAEVVLSAEELGLAVEGIEEIPEPADWLEAPELIGQADEETVKAALVRALRERFPTGKTTIVYNKESKAFETATEESEEITLPEESLGQVVSAAQQLQTSCEMTGLELNMDSAAQVAAVEQANAVLDLKLVMTFSPAQGTGGTVTVSRDKLAGFYTISDDGTQLTLSESAVYSYVENLCYTYSVAGSYTKFISHSGSEININIPHGGCEVDATALYEKLLKQLTECKSADWRVSYSTNSSGDSTIAYGGDYIEIDLSSQCLWMYRDGVEVLCTAIVSGDVATGHKTPQGNYSIYYSSRGQTLTGPGYADYTNYFWAFSGNYGIHDATWRSSFGGSTYLYDGSHGCVNIPYSAAVTMAQYMKSGMHVILYGGAKTVEDRVQTLSGTTSYQVEETAGTFSLNVTAAYSAALSYSSSNTAVATVSSDGVVTVCGKGTAVITVTSEAGNALTSATLNITVKVGEESGGNTGEETGGSTGGETGGSTGGETGGSTGGETGGSTSGETGGSTGEGTGGSTGGETGGSTGGETGGSTGGETGGSTGGETGGSTGGGSGSGNGDDSGESGRVTEA